MPSGIRGALADHHPSATCQAGHADAANAAGKAGSAPRRTQVTHAYNRSVPCNTRAPPGADESKQLVRVCKHTPGHHRAASQSSKSTLVPLLCINKSPPHVEGIKTLDTLAAAPGCQPQCVACHPPTSTQVSQAVGGVHARLIESARNQTPSVLHDHASTGTALVLDVPVQYTTSTPSQPTGAGRFCKGICHGTTRRYTISRVPTETQIHDRPRHTG